MQLVSTPNFSIELHEVCVLLLVAVVRMICLQSVLLVCRLLGVLECFSRGTRMFHVLTSSAPLMDVRDDWQCAASRLLRTAEANEKHIVQLQG